MTDWEVLTLEEAGVTLLDCDHKTPTAREVGRPYVGIPQMTTGRVIFETARKISEDDYVHWTRKTKYQTDDVILSRRTNPGVTAVDDTGTDFALGQNLVLLRANGSRVRSDFLRWMVHTPEWWEQIDKYLNVGAVFSSLKCRDVPKFELTVPPITEQETISSILRPISDKIELNRGMNETLEEMARALFRDWFVDFGPTRRQIEGATDPTAIMGGAFPPEKATTLAPLFPAKLGDDGLPDGWEISTLAAHMAIHDAKRVPLSAREREKRVGRYPYHGATSVMGYVDDFLFDNIILLVGEDGSVIKPNGKPFTQYVWGEVWVNNHAHVLTGTSFSTEQLKIIFDNVDIAPFTTGAVQLKLNQKNMKTIPLVFAVPTVHAAFDAVILPMFAKIRANIEENQTLASLRDLLLPKLMSGEIRLKDAEVAA